jgi:hypothetical protein
VEVSQYPSTQRHPAAEGVQSTTVSGSILPLYSSVSVARWMLERQSPEVKQVQHDTIFIGEHS